LAGTHAPAVQGVGRHEPLEHAFVGAGQEALLVASGTLDVAVHTGAPAVQSMAAVAMQAFWSVQTAPCWHATHAPVASQT